MTAEIKVNNPPKKFRKYIVVRLVDSSLWYSATDNLDRSFPFMNLIIYRTKYEHGGSRWSVISGFGTFGGQDGLLELMIDNKEPIGNLTAEEVLMMMDEYNRPGKENKDGN